MRYTVTWDRSAQDELLEIWLASKQRADVTDAANAIDRELSFDALEKGVDFYGDRILVCQPIAATGNCPGSA